MNTQTTIEKLNHIGYGHLGNGLTFYDKTKEEHGDYKKVAHANPFREIKFYTDDQKEREYVENIVLWYDGARSETQDHKVFHTPPVNKTFKYLKEERKCNYIPEVIKNIPNTERSLIDYTGTSKYFIDAKNRIILQNNAIAIDRQARRLINHGPPQVGDIVYKGKERMRIAMMYEDSFQPCFGGSFHISKNGYSSMSGGLESSLPLSNLKKKENRELAKFWFFSNNWAKADNGVYYKFWVNAWSL